jgi:protein involved in polysaccharide export with SLBB domain
MPKFPRILLLVALAAGCLPAASQDKSDYFGQVPAAAEPEPTPAPLKRVNISNRPEAEPADGARKAPPEAARPKPALAPAEDLRPLPSEFQKFIFDSTGQAMPLFGADFFAYAPSTFAPIGGTPVPEDFLLGAGDEVLIRGWGSIDIDYRARIDRNGMIAIPTIGSVVLAGVKAGQAEAVIGAAVAKLYKGVTINVGFGQLRAITVYVVGQAKRPGTYTVSSLSTLVTAVFASGGPNPNGSMRRVQVRRGAAVVAELDLYAFIAKGDKSSDIKLRDGDTIVIPVASGHVALMGKVNTPAIYELRRGGDSIESLLEFAGGMPVVADPRGAALEHIDAGHNQPRSVEQFTLDAAGLKRQLKNGDVLRITPIMAEFSNAVVLRGNVNQPMRAPFRAGMRVSDLIPGRDYLISRKSVQRRNSVLNGGEQALPEGGKVDTLASRIGDLIDGVNWDYAVVERVNRANLSVSLIPFNLGKVFSDPGSRDNVLLEAGDTVTIFSDEDVAVPMAKRRVFVRVEGEVNTPGVYQMAAGDSLQALLAKAGGPTANAYLFGTAFYRETVRREQELNLEKAATRLETELRNEQSHATANIRATTDPALAEARRQAQQTAIKESVARLRSLKPTGRIAFGLNPAERSFGRLPPLRLENGDRLVLPAKAEFVHIFGAVNAEASPLWVANRRVNDYLKLVGLMRDADRDNVFIMRVDGSVVTRDSGWSFGGFGGVEVMPGDTIVVPEKFDKESAWTKFTQGTREWAQIFANFGLGAAAIKTLRD